MDTSTTENGNDAIKKSKYLDFRLTVLFQQYASKLNRRKSADRLINSNSASMSSRHKKKTALPASSLSTSDSLALGVYALMDVLNNVGPAIKEEQAKEFIYEYDSTLEGALVLQDFLGINIISFRLSHYYIVKLLLRFYTF